VAWRNLVGSILEEALRSVVECAKSGEPSTCARLLIASADAVYTPLKPVDSGLGEARRIASLLAGIVSNSFILAAQQREDADSFLRSVLESLEAVKEEARPLEEASTILERASATAFQPAVSREARETIYSDLKNYVEPPRPAVPRRRRQPRRPDPRQNLRRLLRELGRRDPILAKQVSQQLRGLGVA
jgi:hypothetical protein